MIILADKIQGREQEDVIGKTASYKHATTSGAQTFARPRRNANNRIIGDIIGHDQTT